jgi:hypothetical protein
MPSAAMLSKTAANDASEPASSAEAEAEAEAEAKPATRRMVPRFLLRTGKS